MSRPLHEVPMLALDTRALLSPQVSTLLARRAEEAGPVLRWTIPVGQQTGREAVFLIGPEANRLVMHTQRECFSHEQGWSPYIGSVMGKGLMNMDSPEHTHHRKLWNPAFTQSRIETYLSSIQQVISERTAEWVKQDVVDLHAEASAITFQVVTSALAGLGHGSQIEHIQRLFFTLLGMSNPDPRGLEERTAKARQARDELNGIFLEMIARQRKIPEAAAPRDVLDSIVHARDEEGNLLSEEQILGHLDILLLAGYQATSVLSTFVLHLLAVLPEHRQRVEKEMRDLAGDASDLLSLATLRQMKYLDNFIKEAGRVYAPTFVSPRRVIRDVEFAGYLLPAGTFVHLGLAACHRLSTVFSNPDIFDPDRFAPPREEDRRTPYGLVTFSGGPRLCIGVNFASIEMKMLVLHVLRFYHLEPASQQPPDQIGFIGNIIPKPVPVRVTALVPAQPF